MNAEVLAEAVRAYVQAGKRGLKLDEAMACALEIAYADAARVLRHGVIGSREYCKARLECAEAIEDRAR